MARECAIGVARRWRRGASRSTEELGCREIGCRRPRRRMARAIEKWFRCRLGKREGQVFGGESAVSSGPSIVDLFLHRALAKALPNGPDDEEVRRDEVVAEPDQSAGGKRRD